MASFRRLRLSMADCAAGCPVGTGDAVAGGRPSAAAAALARHPPRLAGTRAGGRDHTRLPMLYLIAMIRS
jgi:hypothetical protein